MNRVANQALAFVGNGEGSRAGGGLPHSQDAEMGVLGSMLQDRNALTEALDRMRPEHFFIPANRSTFTALGAFYHQEKKQALDLITFTQAFTDGIRIRENANDPGYMLRIEEVGGASYDQPLHVRAHGCERRLLPGHSAREISCAGDYRQVHGDHPGGAR
jgi:hypothetical protein